MTWIRLLIWLAIGFVVYFSYSAKHSVLGKHLDYQQVWGQEDETDTDNEKTEDM